MGEYQDEPMSDAVAVKGCCQKGSNPRQLAWKAGFAFITACFF